MPPIDGIDAVPHVTSDTVWDIQTLPQRVLVLGGGAIGCELGQALAALGSRVFLMNNVHDDDPALVVES